MGTCAIAQFVNHVAAQLIETYSNSETSDLANIINVIPNVRRCMPHARNVRSRGT